MSALKTIAHYTIEHELGRGGMGVVYRAVDTRLGRAVAIKSLPAEFVSDVVWRTRFEGEARTLAAINHPNIAAIYGIESDETGTYLVLELAEGPTLGERIIAGAPGVEEGLEITRQIALGLGEAHTRGVVHRDLKPANVKVRADGVVKVLDFGIAKAGQADIAVDPLAATLVQKVSPRSTVPAFLLGTPGYMSPEQARGHVITGATDVWSLGCVLYEVLAHRAAFGGETLADTIAQTILGEPDYSVLPRQTPGRVLRLIQTCLKKKVAERAVTMRDIAVELGEALRGASAGRVVVSLRGGMPAAEAEVGNLEPPETVLAGRDRVLAELGAALNSKRLVTLVGACGAGTSSLARMAGAKAGLRGGAWWVPLGAGTHTALPGLLTAFALGARGSGGSVSEAMVERIGTREMLLVLDDVSAQQDAVAGMLDLLLRACPHVRVLATGTAALGLAGETVIEASRSVGEGAQLEAVRMLMSMLGPAEQASWGERAQELARVCRAFRGSPGALRMVAAVAPTVSPVQFEAQARQRAALAGVSDLAAISAERGVLLMAGWAMDTLPVAELALLLRASAFVGPWSVRSLAELALGDGVREEGRGGAAEGRLEVQVNALVRAGLVTRVRNTGRPLFVLHRSTRREARDRLLVNGGASAMVAREYARFVESLARCAAGPVRESVAARLEESVAELVEAGTAPARAAVLALCQYRGFHAGL